jgi:hypothetical protein
LKRSNYNELKRKLIYEIPISQTTLPDDIAMNGINGGFGAIVESLFVETEAGGWLVPIDNVVDRPINGVAPAVDDISVRWCVVVGI